MNALATMGRRLADYSSLVKLSHSVFAMPFALLALLTATGGAPSLRLLGLVVAAVVAARTAAMAYNRFADREIDRSNPRTAGREIPRGIIRPGAALTLCAGASACFLCVAWMLSPLCFWLALPTLGWLLLYSHCKRFSAACHLWLGVALGISPVAAWLAADGEFSMRILAPAVLGVGVALWVAGFDVLYACLDEAFDRAHGLHSAPALLGRARALLLSRWLHAVAVLAFAGFGVLAPLGTVYQIGVLFAAALMVWQHRLLHPADLSRVQTAFFTANGTIAIGMLALGCIDIYLFPASR